MAIDRRFTRQGEEKQADFIPIVAWEKLQNLQQIFSERTTGSSCWENQTRSWMIMKVKGIMLLKLLLKKYILHSKRDSSTSRSDENTIGDTMGNTVGTGKEDGFYQIEEDDELPF